MTLAVATHEVAGHWSTAVANDYTATELRIGLDGTGHVHMYRTEFYTASPSHPELAIVSEVSILAGGVVATTLIGFVLLVAGVACRRRPLVSSALLIVAALHLLDAPTYILRDIASPEPGGDIDAIMMSATSDAARVPFVILAAFGAVAITIFVTIQLFRRVEDLCGPLSTGSIATLLVGLAALLLACPIAYSLHPDALPGTWTPAGVVLGSLLLAAAHLLRHRRRGLTERPGASRYLGAAVAASWFAALALAGVIIHVGLHRGVDLIGG
jgi:hypothetical protein